VACASPGVRFQRHYSIYPATARVTAELEEELTGRVHSKATIRFPLEAAVPTRLITRIAKLRAAEVADRSTKAASSEVASRKAKPAARKKPRKQDAKKR
jgi:uncharacterized protein YdhG (YjbR/CyaY superfamily)